jgi:transcriptional regulator with XRE-family HTH domain
LDPLKDQFIRLFELSGWSQAEAARQLKSERATINGIVTGEANPSEPLLELLRLKLEVEKPGELNRIFADEEIREGESPAGDLKIWRRRAKDAEKRLDDFQNKIRKALADSSTTPVSSVGPDEDAATADAGGVVDSVLHEESSRSPAVDVPSSQTYGPRPRGARPSTTQRASPKRAPKSPLP